jgi:glycosyltransferase involved in cell wall biosynthesis
MFGVPVVTNSIATIPSIIDNGKTGFLLKKNSPEEISSLISKKTNWEKMGLNGRKKFLKNFEEKKYAKKFLEIFDGL